MSITGWLGKYRRPIGYTIGGLNVLAALFAGLRGDITSAVCSALIGIALIWDAAELR